MTTTRRAMELGVVGGLLALGLAVGGPVRAESWCAEPLTVHEWGVHVFGTDGARAPTVDLPGWFHTGTSGAAAAGPAVRDLPADSGVRALPVVQFYGQGFGGPIPVGLEVGFAGGPAAAWYPQVDLLRTAADANGPAARIARAELLLRRAGRGLRAAAPEALPVDPTRQLVWSRLELTPAAQRPPVASGTPWVDALRGVDGALWVNGGAESERFLFYEADTRERLPLALERGVGATQGRRALRLRNAGLDAVHDVFVVTREAGATFVVYLPTVAAGAVTDFVLDDHRVAPGGEGAATVERLRAALVDDAPAANDWRAGSGGCVMMRDPAVPFERAEGHRLYGREVDAILGVWARRFFERPGTTVVYREDPATIEAAMPLSVFTDMFHHVVLRRAGLALWESVTLP